jgi:hypothetical protein
LAITYPLTYYFGTASNLIGVLLENEISGANEAGDILIVHKGFLSGDGEILVYDETTKRLSITNCNLNSDTTHIIGAVIEERFNGK